MASITETLLTDLKHAKDFVKKESSGDLDTISGLENLAAAVLRRIVTEPGSLVHRPTYGVGLKRFQNAPFTLATQRRIAADVNEQLVTDSRILEVNSVRFEQDRNDPGKVTMIVSVTPDGFDEILPVAIPFGEVV